MSDLARRLSDTAARTLHDATCPDRHCEPQTWAALHPQARKMAAAVLRELAAGYRESAAAWVSRETDAQMRMDLRAARQISRLADEIEATPSTSDPDGR